MTATKQVIIPGNQLAGMNPQHKQAIISFAQSIQPAITDALKDVTGTTSQNQQALYLLQQQVQSILNSITTFNAKLAALAASIAAIPTSSVQPIIETFGMMPAITRFPVAVYEMAQGICAPADDSSLDTMTPLLGIAIGLAPSGKCYVVTFGDYDLPTWDWTPNLPVIVGTAGMLTQTLPLTGVVGLVGFAPIATRIRVNVPPPVQLSSSSTNFLVLNPDGTYGVNPISLSHPPAMFFEAEEGEQGMPIPGLPGATGPAGAAGANGPALIFDPDQGEEGMPIPGATGIQGIQGLPGVPVFFDAEQGEEGMPVPGNPGAQGTAGSPGQIIFMEPDQGEVGDPIPGQAGAQGIQGVPGPSVFMEADAGEEGMPIPGSSGSQGPQGIAGTIIFMEADQGEDGAPIPSPPGAASKLSRAFTMMIGG